MMDRVLILFASVAVAALSPVLAADDRPACFAGAHLGTGGLGGSGGCQVNDTLTLRLAIERADTDLSQNIDGVEYDVSAGLGFTRFQLDWFPTATGFYVSGGLANTDIGVEGTANPTGAIEVGSATVAPESLEMSVRFKGVSPYAGLGWLANVGRHLSLRTEIGVSKLGDPEVTLVERGTSVISEVDIQAEVDQVVAEYDGVLSVYPYLRFGIEYRF